MQRKIRRDSQTHAGEDGEEGEAAHTLKPQEPPKYAAEPARFKAVQPRYQMKSSRLPNLYDNQALSSKPLR